MILLFLSAAYGLDAHGPTVAAPTGDSVSEPFVVWSPDFDRRLSLGLNTEFIDTPLTQQLVLPQGIETHVLLDNVFVSTFAGRLPLNDRFSFSWAIPMHLSSQGYNAIENPFGLLDATVGLPITLRAHDAALAMELVPQFGIPLGDPHAFLGMNQPSYSLHLNIGQRWSAWNWSMEGGLILAPDAETALSAQALDADLDRRNQLRLGASLGWTPLSHLGFGVEMWSRPALSDQKDWPTEWLGRVGVGLPGHLRLGMGAGMGVGGAAGSANFRAQLRLDWTPPPKPMQTVPTPVVVAPLPPPDPYSLFVQVRDTGGDPVDAQLTITGRSEPVQTGADGDESLLLAPGLWQIEIAAEGRETQRRTVVISEGQYHRTVLQAILPPSENGDAEVHLELLDWQGVPVDGASVAVDGTSRGQTSSGGTLDLLGLHSGERIISVNATDFSPVAPLTLSLSEGRVDRRLYLARPVNSVRVRAHTATGPVANAVVRIIGPEPVEDANLDMDGSHTFVLSPGTWTVILSAEAYGIQERELVITKETLFEDVEFVLESAEQGAADLIVRVVDPNGDPIEGAEVRMGDHALGTTASGGILRVKGLAPGSRSISVSGPHLRPSEPRSVDLGPGERELLFSLAWLPGSVRVQVRGPSGGYLDAETRWIGPSVMPPASLGPDGEGFFQLEPGNWQLIVSAPEFGVQARDVVVKPDDIQLIEIDAGMLREEGTAIFNLHLRDPEGSGPGGIQVFVDGQMIGNSGPGGSIRLEGLAVGKHQLRVQADGFLGVEQGVNLKEGENNLELRLSWAGTRLQVRALTPQGPATDAWVRALGAQLLPPYRVGADGTHILQVAPGTWDIIASSELYGLGDVPMDVPASTSLIPVDVVLNPPEPALATLLLEVVDPAGHQVPDVVLTLGGEIRTMGADGRLIWADLTPGSVELSATAVGFAPISGVELSIGEGMQTRRLSMNWLPRAVAVTIKNTKEMPVDAHITLEGDHKKIEVQAGEDGAEQLLLTPGPYTLLVQANADLEMLQQSIIIPPGGAAMPLPIQLKPSRIELTTKEVKIHEQVFFAYDRALIDQRSFAVLSEVAATLKLHPEIVQVEIQGHTDAKGSQAYNLQLSQQRADAVRDWLIREGIDPARLKAVGYGNTQPLASNTTEAGRQKNRRVQFEIQQTNASSSP